MPYLLDDRPLATAELSNDCTVRELIDAARLKLDRDDALIVGVRYRDRDIGVGELEEILERPAREFDGLHLISGQPHDVVLDALRQSQATFSETFPFIQTAADDISAGRIGPAMEQLVTCVDIWGQTHNAVIQSIALLGISTQGLELAGRPLESWLADLAQQLKSLRDSIEARDMVALCDLLRYELDDTLQAWEQMLDGLVRHIETAKDNGRHRPS